MRLLTIGTFDLFHTGHLNLLICCRHVASEVIVGVNSDRFIDEYKGRPPVVGETERMRIVEHIKGVARVLLNDGPGRELVEQVMPDVVAVGSDWHERDYLKQIGMTQRWLDEHRIALLYLPRTPNVSSTSRRTVMEVAA